MTPPTKAMLELADEVRIPLHELQADVDYLIGRVVADGSCGGMITASIKEKLNAIETALRSSQNGERERVIEECAQWHEDQSRLAMNSLHCGDNATTIQMTRIRAEWHDNAAAAIRALKSGEKGS